ncbi:MAG: endonuclease III [Chloroflexi bacterium]|nr:endonuclease III [Chloroflexota bacterium]
MKTKRRHTPRVPPELVLDRLEQAYGYEEWSPRMTALDELLFTVLTQHTSDSNAEVAFTAMRKRYPTWGVVLEADTKELANTIRSGGLANQKAPRLQLILMEILRRKGEFNIEFLGDLPLEEARTWLTTLPGVGPKTAAVTLAFSLGMPAMPVDTHIYRVGKRIGLISMTTNVDDAHVIMEAQVPKERVYSYHVQLIAHGRQTCKAIRPLCDRCALQDLCPSAPTFAAAFEKPKFKRPIRSGKPL